MNDEKVWTQFVVGPGQDLRESFPIPGGYAYVSGANGSVETLLRITVEVFLAGGETAQVKKPRVNWMVGE